MKYRVHGHVFVPNEFAIEVEAPTPEAAMEQAKTKLNARGQLRASSNYILGNSQDEAAAFDYHPLTADPV